MERIYWDKIIKHRNTQYFVKYKHFTAEINDHKTCFSITIKEKLIFCETPLQKINYFSTVNSCKKYFRKFLIENINLTNK